MRRAPWTCISPTICCCWACARGEKARKMRMAAHTAALNFRLDLTFTDEGTNSPECALSDNRRMQPPPNLAPLDVRRKTLIIREVAAISLAPPTLPALAHVTAAR